MEPRPAPGEKSARRLRPTAVALMAVLLLLPPLLLIHHYANRKTSRPPGAPAPVESPSFRPSGDASGPPFGGLKEPKDAVLDSLGRLWVADFGNSRLRLFDRAGAYLGGWGGVGDSMYAFRDLCGVAIRGEDLYVADTWNGRIQSFTTSGQWKATVAGLSSPRGVAVARDGTVWVSDTGNHRVIAYDALLRNPREFGKKGPGPGEFSFPIGITFDDLGNVFVADCGNRRIVLLEPDGRYKAAWPVPGWEPPVRDSYLEMDVDGNLFATDPGKDTLLKFDRTGAVVERQTSDEEGRAFSAPTGLALDSEKRLLYIVNSGTSSIFRIALPKIEKKRAAR